MTWDYSGSRILHLMHTVYRLVKTPKTGNSHSICREETWSFAIDNTYATLEEASDYVIRKNLEFCSYDLYLNTGSLTKEVLEDRCLKNPAYLSRRLYFVGKPSIELLKEQLRNSSIKVDG